MNELEKRLTTSQAAELWAVLPEQVREWIVAGELEAINIAKKGSRRASYRITPEAFAKFEKSRIVGVETAGGERKPKSNVKKYI